MLIVRPTLHLRMFVLTDVEICEVTSVDPPLVCVLFGHSCPLVMFVVLRTKVTNNPLSRLVFIKLHFLLAVAISPAAPTEHYI